MSLPPFSTVEATNPWSAMWTRTHDADPSYQIYCQRWWSAERCGYFCTPMLAIQQMNAGFFPRCLNTSWLFMFSLFDWLFELFFLGQETLHCMGHCQYEAFSNGQPHPIVDVSGLSDAEIRKLSGNAFWFNLVSVCVCVCFEHPLHVLSLTSAHSSHRIHETHNCVLVPPKPRQCIAVWLGRSGVRSFAKHSFSLCQKTDELFVPSTTLEYSRQSYMQVGCQVQSLTCAWLDRESVEAWKSAIQCGLSSAAVVCIVVFGMFLLGFCLQTDVL